MAPLAEKRRSRKRAGFFQKMEVSLPPAALTSGVPLETCLRKRRTNRAFSDARLMQSEVSQLLWAAQGISGLGGLRTCPSAGALYPLECYLVVANVDGLRPGVYRYDPDRHLLVLTAAGGRNEKLIECCLDQECAGEGAVSIIVTGAYKKMTAKFGERGIRLAHMEAGHAAQNVCLQATALGLGVIAMGVFDDAALAAALELPESHQPLYVIIAGRKFV